MILEMIGEKEIWQRRILEKCSAFLSFAHAFANFVIIYVKLPRKLSMYNNALNDTL